MNKLNLYEKTQEQQEIIDAQQKLIHGIEEAKQNKDCSYDATTHEEQVILHEKTIKKA